MKTETKSGFTLIELIIAATIILIVMTLIGGCVAFGILGCAATKVIEKDGLKGIGERVWEGTNAVEQVEGVENTSSTE